MTKKILSIILVFLLIFVVISSCVKADNDEEIVKLTGKDLSEYTYLDKNAPKWVLFKQANNYIAIWTPEKEHESLEFYYNAVRTTGNKGWASTILDASKVEFFYGENTTKRDNGKNISTYAVVEKEDGWYAYSKKNKISNIIVSKDKAKYGSLRVGAKVTKQHEKITYRPIWQKTYQEVWQKTYQPIWQKTIQNYLVPTFKKDVTSLEGTLVTWLENGKIEGGKFGNGMTWLKLDAQKLKNSEDGVSYTIADSSPSNKPIEYKYNAKIVGDELIISFDERLISTSVTAKLFTSQPSKHDPSGHVSITTGKELKVKIPKSSSEDEENNELYMFVHFERLSWFTTGKYEFVEWVQDDSRTEVTEKHLRDELVSDKKIRTEEIADKWIRDEEVSREVITDEYNKEFDVVIKDANGKVVYEGKVKNNGEISIDKLRIGEYTCTLSGKDFDSETNNVTIKENEETVISFDDIIVIGEDEKEYLDKEYDKDEYIEKRYDAPVYLKEKEYEKPDIIKTPIKLGDEENPDGEYAIKLN